ncbi:hypothetical protein [Candidatus Poriferisodalis sp.]|uniref:hypothetical protein n=1 Tax=Candidatus Poriferisodalis sp. TaxID=3101277 RepID=UPI003B51879D
MPLTAASSMMYVTIAIALTLLPYLRTAEEAAGLDAGHHPSHTRVVEHRRLPQRPRR